MDLFDSHCHLDFPSFDHDRDAILARCHHLGIKHIIIPGVTCAGWKGILELCSGHDGMLYPALGLHPVFLKQHKESHLLELVEQINSNRPVAIGEIGLDYYIRQHNKEMQLNYFDVQLGIAEDAGLPVILHVRKAHDQVLKCLHRRRKLKGGVAHAFNGSLQQAEQYLSMGFKLGFGGAITWPRARKLRHLVQQLPLTALVLETDAPDMTPAAHHGERNQPDYLPEIVAVLAQLRSEEPGTVARQTTANAMEIFNLHHSSVVR